MATGPLVITPLVLALGLRATLAPLLPILLVAAFLSTQLGRLAALRPHLHGTAAAAPDADRWGPFGRLAVVVMSRSVVYTGLSSFLPLFFAGVLGRTKAEGATALSILLGTGVVGTLAGGRLADRFGRRVVILVSMTALAPLLYALASARDSRVARGAPRPGRAGALRPVQRPRRHGAGVPPEPRRDGLGRDGRPRGHRGRPRRAAPGPRRGSLGGRGPLFVVSALPLLAVALALTLPDSRAVREPGAAVA